MVIAVILAGGKGNRFGAHIPKQYISVQGKPLIVYTLEKFQKAEEIDFIEVVCEDFYRQYIESLAHKYKITKLKWYATAGRTCQESTRNGLYALEDKCKKGDIIVFHMSISPLVSYETISKGIKLCKSKGSAFPYHQNLIHLCKNQGTVLAGKYVDKDKFWSINMPWTLEFERIDTLFHYAYENGIETHEKGYLPSILSKLNEPMYLYPDNEENRLKITNKSDLLFFEGFLLAKQNFVGRDYESI